MMTGAVFLVLLWVPLDPPAQFLHSYHGRLTEYGLKYSELQRTCPSRRPCGAWAAIGKGWCKIILPTDVPPDVIARLRQHEIAHCNGWRHD